MSEPEESRNWKGAIWGVFLILLGAGFLAERYGMISVPGMAGLWPIVLFVIGITHLVDRRPGSAVMFLLLGVIFLASANEWWGLRYHNSWPLLMVAAGVGIVIKALSREDARPRKVSGVDIVMGEVRRDQ
jgi:hypothetical protein